MEGVVSSLKGTAMAKNYMSVLAVPSYAGLP